MPSRSSPLNDHDLLNIFCRSQQDKYHSIPQTMLGHLDPQIAPMNTYPTPRNQTTTTAWTHLIHPCGKQAVASPRPASSEHLQSAWTSPSPQRLRGAPVLLTHAMKLSGPGGMRLALHHAPSSRAVDRHWTWSPGHPWQTLWRGHG